jgi:hypothetical protein
MSIATSGCTNASQYKLKTPALPTKAKAYWVIYFYEYYSSWNEMAYEDKKLSRPYGDSVIETMSVSLK